MSVKLFIYIFSSVIVIWSIESINIAGIFKKNRVYQARVFYFLLALCMIELLTNLIYNVYELIKF